MARRDLSVGIFGSKTCAMNGRADGPIIPHILDKSERVCVAKLEVRGSTTNSLLTLFVSPYRPVSGEAAAWASMARAVAFWPETHLSGLQTRRSTPAGRVRLSARARLGTLSACKRSTTGKPEPVGAS
jgi:hypothetical protein